MQLQFYEFWMTTRGRCFSTGYLHLAHVQVELLYQQSHLWPCDDVGRTPQYKTPTSSRNLFLQNLLARIPSDRQLWWSSRIHRTVVTFVTLVLFLPDRQRAVLQHRMTHTNKVTRNAYRIKAWKLLIGQPSPQQVEQPHWCDNSVQRYMRIPRSLQHRYPAERPPSRLPMMWTHYK